MARLLKLETKMTAILTILIAVFVVFPLLLRLFIWAITPKPEWKPTANDPQDPWKEAK
jgi:hypothetical protein